MFASKVAILISLLALSSSVIAMPPACLLAAVEQQPNPANLTAVCGVNGHKVQQVIASICGSNVAAAESAFAATCSSAGQTVASYTASASSKPSNSANGTFVYTTHSYDSSCSCTKTIVESTTGAVPSAQATGSATATFSTATGSASAGATGAAAPGAQQAVGSLAAAVVAVAGLVVWL